jgi:hypothetical protein
VRYYVDDDNTKAHAFFVLLERWIRGDSVTDADLKAVLTEDSYAIYDRRLGKRKRTEQRIRTRALKAAFKQLEDEGSLFGREYTNEQLLELERKLDRLKKQSWER